jgi:hypothetical protein
MLKEVGYNLKYEVQLLIKGIDYKIKFISTHPDKI